MAIFSSYAVCAKRERVKKIYGVTGFGVVALGVVLGVEKGVRMMGGDTERTFVFRVFDFVF